MSYGWASTEQSKSLRDNAAAIELSLAAKRTATAGARRKRKLEDDSNRRKAEIQMDACSLDVTFTVVSRAASFFNLCILAANQLGREKFQQKLGKPHLVYLTDIVIATVLAFALPVRPGAFIAVTHSVMREYIDAVLKNPDNWETVAPTSLDFKNRSSAHFTHEALLTSKCMLDSP